MILLSSLVALPTAMKSGLKDTRRLASLRTCSKIHTSILP